MIGIYAGETKPSDTNQLLKPFVDETVKMCTERVSFEGAHVDVHFHALIFDAPAKSMVLNTKGHSDYYSCSKCTIRGSYM